MILRQFSRKFSTQFNFSQGVKYSKEGTFNASPLTVFDCIKNTQNYSQFIPWCSKSTITKTVSPTQNFTELTITFQKVKSLSYLSHVQIFGQNTQNKKFKVQSICKQEPLKSLVSIWEIDTNAIIQGENERSQVKYSIEYQFASPILQLTSHLFLDYVGESMWVIFKEQAEKIQKSKDIKGKDQRKVEVSFGKSQFSVENQDNFQNWTQKQSTATNLAQYLGKNPKIHEIYMKNSELKKKIDNWSTLLNGTKDFEQKLEFNIKNYLIHKG